MALNPARGREYEESGEAFVLSAGRSLPEGAQISDGAQTVCGVNAVNLSWVTILHSLFCVYRHRRAYMIMETFSGGSDERVKT